ncbi:uncharacterized protein LOC114277207 [Camellia sinensis]|uniref:uncharacterized protein LOC114277207 n=1 Tax=Camellia sinensis TaxID=4442 RepID=UPI0010359D19|nr:uncharacterized protein LOC114277207 [Camellia sinensis]
MSMLACLSNGGGNLALKQMHFGGESFVVNTKSSCQIKVGDGCRIRFWYDKWCGSTCLKDEFPPLFNLSVDKEGSLQQFLARKTNDTDWNFNFRRALYTWELPDVSRLLSLLASAPSLTTGCVDCLVWNPATAGSGPFSASSLYSFSTSLLGPDLTITKFIWCNPLPPKVLFFGWLAWKNRVKTAVFLHNLGILGSNTSPYCIFCKSTPESANHALLHCPFSWSIWSAVLSGWGIQWCIPYSVADLFNWWLSRKLRDFIAKIWRAIPFVVLWSLWKHRNDCVFSNAHPNSVDLWELIKIRLAHWLKASIKDFPFSVSDLVCNWRNIRSFI